MGNIRHIISDVSNQTGIESYKLRFWEDELNLTISRDEMGYRYYNEKDIELFKAIKVLKDNGYQIPAIKLLLTDVKKYVDSGEGFSSCLEHLHLNINKNIPITTQPLNEVFEVSKVNNSQDINDEEIIQNKLVQFSSIIHNIVTDSLRSNNSILTKEITESVSSNVISHVDVLLRLKEEKEETHFRQIDKLLRDIQNSRTEVAASKNVKKKRKFFFKKT